MEVKGLKPVCAKPSLIIDYYFSHLLYGDLIFLSVSTIISKQWNYAVVIIFMHAELNIPRLTHY